MNSELESVNGKLTLNFSWNWEDKRNFEERFKNGQ
jgi:hypothetical protein